MAIRCPECDEEVQPVSAPAVLNRELDTDCTISGSELDGWTPPDGVVEPVMSDIVFFCPICRYVFASEDPDSSWLWIDWSGIPVVLAKPEPLTLGID